jgi:transposase InsO family protein
MQIKGLHKNIYRLSQYALSQEKADSYRKRYEVAVKKWKAAKSQGCDEVFCQDHSGISKATYYRYKKKLKQLSKGILPPSNRPKRLRRPLWGESEKQLVLRIRRENPTYGKMKIAIILKRDFDCQISESTVGRILKSLQNKGLVLKSGSALRFKRKRNFSKGHAQPWEYKDYKKMVIGERVQIDHMTVTKNGVCMKHFQAWDRKSKFIATEVYHHAKSSSAKRFLLEIVAKLPFKILSIQVDGGSEFMAEFEQACGELCIPLIVLPPSKPAYNGGVERGNRIFREEFYARHDILADSVGAFRPELNKAVHKYNTYRPHCALKGLTPMQYILNYLLDAAA